MPTNHAQGFRNVPELSCTVALNTFYPKKLLLCTRSRRSGRTAQFNMVSETIRGPAAQSNGDGLPPTPEVRQRRSDCWPIQGVAQVQAKCVGKKKSTSALTPSNHSLLCLFMR